MHGVFWTHWATLLGRTCTQPNSISFANAHETGTKTPWLRSTYLGAGGFECFKKHQCLVNIGRKEQNQINIILLKSPGYATVPQPCNWTPSFGLLVFVCEYWYCPHLRFSAGQFFEENKTASLRSSGWTDSLSHQKDAFCERIKCTSALFLTQKSKWKSITSPSFAILSLWISCGWVLFSKSGGNEGVFTNKLSFRGEKKFFATLSLRSAAAT